MAVRSLTYVLAIRLTDDENVQLTFCHRLDRSLDHSTKEAQQVTNGGNVFSVVLCSGLTRQFWRMYCVPPRWSSINRCGASNLIRATSSVCHLSSTPKDTVVRNKDTLGPRSGRENAEEVLALSEGDLSHTMRIGELTSACVQRSPDTQLQRTQPKRSTQHPAECTQSRHRSRRQHICRGQIDDSRRLTIGPNAWEERTPTLAVWLGRRRPAAHLGQVTVRVVFGAEPRALRKLRNYFYLLV